MPNRRPRLKLAGAALALLALGACVPRAAPPAPLPAPAPVPRPVPPPLPAAPASPPTDWATGPLSPGDWRYSPDADRPSATFQSQGIEFVAFCSDRQITLALSGMHGALTVRTSFGERRLPATLVHSEVYGQVPASDPMLDQMAFSRGRFLVTAADGTALVVPAWPEFARVVEDCRGQ